MTEDPLLEVLREVVGALEAEGVSYAVTGSVASAIHGRPVTSLDVDLVVRMTSPQARALARRLPSNYYRDADALVAAAAEHGVANLIDQRSSLKIDLSVLGPGAFNDGVFSRAVTVPYGSGAGSFRVVSAEDIVLMKLEWRRETRSVKQWENALGVVRTQGARLDWAYLKRWAAELGLAADLEALKNQAGV